MNRSTDGRQRRHPELSPRKAGKDTSQGGGNLLGRGRSNAESGDQRNQRH